VTRKFFFQAITFVLGLATADYLVGTALKKMYFSETVGRAAQLNYTMLKTREDIVILGNSRAQHHYNDKMITKFTSMTCYNGGLDGGFGIWFSYAAADAILKRYIPKLLIVEFNPASTGYWINSFEKLAVLLPYKDQFPACRKLVEQRSTLEKVKWISAIYPYNSMINDLVADKIFERHLAHVMGFIPISNKNLVESRDTSAFFNSYSDTSDVLNRESLASLLDICKTKKVSLVFVNSPIFAGKSERLTNQTSAAKQALKMIKDAGFPYWDFTEDKRIVNNPNLFSDQVHLNSVGANYFTSLIIEKIISN
jgi:hypothetical protein